MKKLLAVGLLCLACGAAQAAEIDGVTFDDKVSVGASELVLNGGGTRHMKFGLVGVYVAALYLPAKTADAQAVLTTAQPRRLVLAMRRHVPSQSLLNAFHKGLDDNTSAAERKAIAGSLAKLDELLLSNQAKAHDQITFDIGADGGVLVSYNGQLKGTLEGPAIGPALLKIWLGERPVQANLKTRLLGR